MQCPAFISGKSRLDRQSPEDSTALYGKHVEVLSGKASHRLEISDETVAFLLVLKVHLVSLRRVKHVPQRAGLVLACQFVREHGGPEKLRKRSNLPDIPRASLYTPLPKNILPGLVIIDYVRNGPARHLDSRKLFLYQLIIHLASELLDRKSVV